MTIENGFIILRDAFPDMSRLTENFVQAYRACSHEGPLVEGVGNKFLTRPQVPGSYWSTLDHSLPALRIILHEDVVELGRQLLSKSDIYLRNGGVNEMPPGRTVKWHRDSISHFHAGEDGWSEFMHYPHSDGRGTNPARGCLRIIPGSHTWDQQQEDAFVADLEHRRLADGLPPTYKELAALPDALEPTMPGEISISLGPADLLVRRSSIYHSTHANSTGDGRLMQHWLFRAADHTPNNHRFRWEDYLQVCKITFPFPQTAPSGRYPESRT